MVNKTQAEVIYLATANKLLCRCLGSFHFTNKT